MEKIQLLIKHAKVFNSYLKKFIDADVSVKDGKFYYIDRKHENLFDAEHTIDADGQYMIPGMVDIHMHIESSMTCLLYTSPSLFSVRSFSSFSQSCFT